VRASNRARGDGAKKSSSPHVGIRFGNSESLVQRKERKFREQLGAKREVENRTGGDCCNLVESGGRRNPTTTRGGGQSETETGKKASQQGRGRKYPTIEEKQVLSSTLAV